MAGVGGCHDVGIQSACRTPFLGWLVRRHAQEGQPCEAAAPPRRHRRPHGDPGPTDHGARRRDGHRHPARPPRRGRLPRRALRRPPERPRRQQRPADDHAAADHPDDPRGVPPRGRRHHRDQHLQRQRRLAGRLRPRGPRLRAQRRVRPARPRRGRRGRHRRPAALGRRRARPDDAHGLDLARRQRPGRAQRVLRPARRRLPDGRARPRRRRRRPADDRDDLRHPQRQGRDLRGRDALRGAGASLAGHHLRHHHRRLRSYALGPGHRGVLGLRTPRPPAGGRPQLRAGRARHAPLRRRALAPRRLVRQRLPQRRPAQRLRGVRRDARPDGRRAVRVRGRRLPQRRRRLLRHHARAHRGDRVARWRARPAASRSSTSP